MKRYLFYFLLAVMVVSINSCYYDIAEELYPGSGVPCDTSAITYSLSVKPVLDQKCNSCHSQSLQLGGVILETYTDVLVYVNSGKLSGAINQKAAYSPMPKGGAKLDDCSILKIDKWIQAGAPNN
jgi:hypothetical protein